ALVYRDRLPESLLSAISLVPPLLPVDGVGKVSRIAVGTGFNARGGCSQHPLTLTPRSCLRCPIFGSIALRRCRRFFTVRLTLGNQYVLGRMRLWTRWGRPVIRRKPSASVWL